MHFRELPIESIILGERFREDYGDLTDLKNSIEEKGLIQPISVAYDDTLKRYRLIAGGRRYTAVSELGHKTIPCVLREIDGEIDLRECELYENIKRKDLTWQEQGKLEKEIYNLRGVSYKDLAEELEVSDAALHRRVTLAEAVEAIPELGKMKTEDEAWKSYKALEEKLIVDELAKRAGLTDEPSRDIKEVFDYPEDYEDNTVEGSAKVKEAAACYRLGDALDGMSMLEPESFDFAEVDPPYGVDLKALKQRSDDSTKPIDSYTEISTESYADWLDETASIVHGMLKDNTFCVWWFGLTHFDLVQKTLRLRGFTVADIPGIWVKPNGQNQQPNVNLTSCYEPFFVCRKGKPVLTKPARSNVFAYSPVAGQKKIHTTQRPIELIQELLDTFSLPGARVLCPFLGSGTTLRACYTRGMQGVGWDLDTTIRNKFLLTVKEEEDAGIYNNKTGD